MPIIVDANRAADFTRPLGGRAKEILERINRNKIRIVIGGKLGLELAKTKFGPLLVELLRSGRAHRYSDSDVETESILVQAMALNSDDPHVLALARVSKTRLVYTNDQNLMKDLKNIRIVSPKGKIIASTTSAKITCVLLDNHAG